MRKLLFLDVDGVLNSDAFYSTKNQAKRMKEIQEKHPYMDRTRVYQVSCFDPIAVANLNKIIKETGCELIVSSSWRFTTGLRELFKYVGIEAEISGITGICASRYRGDEIQEFLDQQTEPYVYCILDDDGDMLEWQLKNFIQTDWRVGLVESDVDKAIEILNNKYYDN
jgi:hypothetical protein